MNDKLLKFLNISWILILVSFIAGLAFWASFSNLSTNERISILGLIGIIVTTFTSALTVSLNNLKAKEREYELSALTEKKEVVQHFYNAYFSQIYQMRNPQNEEQVNIEKEMLLFKKGLMNWGSERLIMQYINFENIDREKTSLFEQLESMDEFVGELRKELGFHDSQFTRYTDIILTPDARKSRAENNTIQQ